ncbi:conserved Plasmodium protein, unknown function [Plasmodium sp. gorilla clade G2]|uniref:conserved Plasmodium protein, unknown function n=1 Tax=Plasmodium sp. gorilla clade G2 TaxID=880535 RepID=UPI000D20C5E7|nr:conserved Plasmodium protein, unknown function [Plasmodium sp. gorilla clade G2]SOV19907.1 conserved Plasmodium protein, unknown function [Plasmodium sp. gorilla clade G2]
MKIVQAPFFAFFFFFSVFCFFQCYGIYKNKNISNAFLINKKEDARKEFSSNIRYKSKISNRINKLNEHINNIHVGQIKLGYIYDIKDNDIYIKLKDKDRNVVIKKENNYLLENKLLYDYLYDRNLIDDLLYNKLSNEKNYKEINEEHKDIQNHYKKEINPCVVLIKEVNEKNDEILGELYCNEISKRKDKIFDKLNELKIMEKKIFIKILKNVRNKYYLVLINDCIKGYLLYDEKLNLSDQLHKNMDTYYNKKLNEKYDDKKKKSKNINNENIYNNNSKRLSAYIIDVNKKLEYVFLSLDKYPENILNQKLEDIQHTILQENLFENNYFKAEVIDYCNNGNNIIVKIFENKNASIRVKIKSHNIINTRNILRNFDYLKNKVLTHEFNKYFTNMDESVNQNITKAYVNKNLMNEEINVKEKNIQTGKNYLNDTNSKDIDSNNHNDPNSSDNNKYKSIYNKNMAKKKKDYLDKFKQFKDQYYGCKDVDALKYINVDDYIYKREKLLYVRIINKTVDRNIYEGSMVHSENINKNIYDIIKQITNKNNICINYDVKLRYPSKVLAFFNNFVILSTKILKTDILTDVIKNQEKNKNNDKSKLPNVVEKDVITLIEKRYIDHENLKVGDIFFCRFENVKRQSIRNVFNLSNSAIINIYNTFFKKDKDSYVPPSKYKEEQHMLHQEIKQKEKKKKKKDINEDNIKADTNIDTNTGTNIDTNIDTNKDTHIDTNNDTNNVLQNNQGHENKKSSIEYLNKNINQITFEELFFEKYDIYFMKAELHKDTEYRLNKNNIDKNFKLLKNISDNYLSGFNKSYVNYSSIREHYILTYLGEENYKIYRQIVSDYFSSNENSYKELLQTDCQELLSTIFDIALENPNQLNIQNIQNFNKLLWDKVKKLNVSELNYVLQDLKKLKNRLYIYPCSYDNQIGRMNLILNNQKPIKKEHILNLNVNDNIKELLIKEYRNFRFPIDYIKELILKKKFSKHKDNDKIGIIYILAEETINLYENSAKDVEPFSEEELNTLRAQVLKKSKKNIMEGSTQEEENFHSSLYDVENNQIRKILYMIKEDLEKQKKKNKLDEVDKEYEEEQKTHIDATELHKNLPELEEMNKLSEDVFYMKLPFVE